MNSMCQVAGHGYKSPNGLRTSSGAGKIYYLYAVSTSRFTSELWIAGKIIGVTVKHSNTNPGGIQMMNHSRPAEKTAWYQKRISSYTAYSMP
jgi:hypothetical protein